jgi:hypothetical protein
MSIRCVRRYAADLVPCEMPLNARELRESVCDAQFVDKPILLKRLRVTAFASTKIGELLDGAGTIVHDGAFAGSDDLELCWKE